MTEHVLNFDDLKKRFRAGSTGDTIARRLQEWEGVDSDVYTVYWPKDSVRVMRGSSYAVARAVFFLLKDAGTRWGGHATCDFEPLISRTRREIAKQPALAGPDEALSPKIFAVDRLLAGDIRTGQDTDPFEIRPTSFPATFDFASLPEH